LAGKTRPKGQCAKANQGEKETRCLHIHSRRSDLWVGVLGGHGPGIPF
jgi:hypothetical protein